MVHVCVSHETQFGVCGMDQIITLMFDTTSDWCWSILMLVVDYCLRLTTTTVNQSTKYSYEYIIYILTRRSFPR